jgi:hypothetical protein
MTLDTAVFRFAGLNLFQASFAGFCPAAIAFRKLGVRPGASFR